MLIQEAAVLLGKSDRTVRKYVAKGKLNVVYVKGKTSDVAHFDPEELRALKAELDEAEDGKPERVKSESGIPEASRALVPTSKVQSSLARNESLNIVQFQASEFPALVQSIAHAFPQTPAKPSIQDLAARPGLTIAEAAYFTGVAEGILRKAIKSGELEAVRIGRADRVQTADVRDWYARQFKGRAE